MFVSYAIGWVYFSRSVTVYLIPDNQVNLLLCSGIYSTVVSDSGPYVLLLLEWF